MLADAFVQWGWLNGNLRFSLQEAGVPRQRDAPRPCPCLQREYPLVRRGMIWCFGFCLALFRLLVDYGQVTPCPPSLLKGNTQTTPVSSLHGQELPPCSRALASPHCLRSRWPSGLMAPSKVVFGEVSPAPAAAETTALVCSLCLGEDTVCFPLKGSSGCFERESEQRGCLREGQRGTPYWAAAAAGAAAEQPVSSGETKPEALAAQCQGAPGWF